MNKTYTSILIIFVFSCLHFCYVNNAKAQQKPTLTLKAEYGKGGHGFSDGNLDAAVFNKPQGMDFDKSGNLFIADTYNHCIRMIDFGTKDHPVKTLIGTCGKPGANNENMDTPVALKESRLNAPVEVSVYAGIRDTWFYVLDSGNNRLLKVKVGGVYKMEISGKGNDLKLNKPLGLSLDQSELLIANSGNDQALVCSESGQLLSCDIHGTGQAGYDPDTRSTIKSRLNKPTDITTFFGKRSFQAVLVSDSNNGVIRLIKAGEEVDTFFMNNFAGSDNPHVWYEHDGSAQMYHMEKPYRLTKSDNLLYVSLPTKNRVIAITSQRNTYVVLDEKSDKKEATIKTPYAIATDVNGDLWLFDSSGKLKHFSLSWE